jgi:hypothetical protein
VAKEKRGVNSIKTMGGLLDNRRARTPSGALLEMSAMSNEKTLLHRELARWKRRHVEIQKRLAEIAAKERRLLAVVQGGEMALGVVVTDDGASQAAGGTPLPLPLPAEVSGRFKVQELSY